MFTAWVIGFFILGLGSISNAGSEKAISLYYEQNAQVELINPYGLRVLIDINDPSALSNPPTIKDVLLTTHNHGDHRRLDFINSFPGKQLDVKTGEIELKDIAIFGIASAHNEGDAFRSEGGTNYIFLIEMAGLRIAHFGDIGQIALTDRQIDVLGRLDIVIMPLATSFSNMTAQNEKAFNLINQVQPKLIIPTHIFDPTCAKMAADKWTGYNSYKKSLSLDIDSLPEKTTIIFMGSNSNFLKLPYSNL